MAPKAHKQKETQHQTQGKSVLFILFIFYLFFLIHCLKFESILTANVEPGLPVKHTARMALCLSPF